MTGSNLPPGVTVGMIPGNRPEDIAAEKAEDELLARLETEGLAPDEYKIVADVGIAAVRAARDLSKKDSDDLQREIKDLNDVIKDLMDHNRRHDE